MTADLMAKATMRRFGYLQFIIIISWVYTIFLQWSGQKLNIGEQDEEHPSDKELSHVRSFTTSRGATSNLISGGIPHMYELA